MNQISASFALAAIAMAAVAAAQVADPSQSGPPAGTAPSYQYQEHTAPPPPASQSSANAAGQSDQKARMDDCMAQQRANNPGMSKQ